MLFQKVKILFGFYYEMELGLSLGLGRRQEDEEEEQFVRTNNGNLNLSLHPFASSSNNNHPKIGFPWSNNSKESSSRELDINMTVSEAEGSPNSSAVSSFHVDLYSAAAGGGTSAVGDGETERATNSRGSDDDENGSSRKKLRLSKEQSAYLEESFKEHSTLNPRQKVALAKQLNLRPRQVEVWFQNRRARTKLKQTEVDCEYLKRCCETLTEENRRLQKELSELRALKAPSNPFFNHMPATTLSMCPSCEKTTTTTATNHSINSANGNGNHSNKVNGSFGSLFAASKARFYPFASRPATSPAS